MRGGPLAHPKKVKGRVNEAGMAERRALLVAEGIPARHRPCPPTAGAGADDMLDALAALVVARHIIAGRGRPFPEPPGRDSHGIPIAIWTYRPDPPPPQDIAHDRDPVPRPMIEAAAQRIAGHARITPVMRLGTGAFGSEADISLKLECLQHAGSFKTRGAFNNLLSLEVPAAGVAAASGGNHGAAVAYAARARGVKATIFVPEISPTAKIEAIRRFGAEVVIGGAFYDDAQAACDRFVAETGALKIHPFAAKETIAGQGTVGREWQEQEPDLDTVLIAVGGGGLISGIAAWFAGTKVKVVGVEPAGSRALQRLSKPAGRFRSMSPRLQPTRSARAMSARSSTPSARMPWTMLCWSPTKPLPRHRPPCGGISGWRSSPAAPRLWAPCSPTPTGRRPANGSACWSAARMSIWANSQRSQAEPRRLRKACAEVLTKG